MSKSTLESLLANFDKAQQLLSDTEALKPRLEKEIADALATGDALDEKTAQALQTKRGQLDLVPAKLAQINGRIETLTTDIQEEFSARFNAFNSDIQAVVRVAKQNMSGFLIPLLHEMQQDNGEEILAFIFPRTKLANQLGGLENAIRFRVAQQDFIAASRDILVAEKALATLNAGVAKN